MRLFAFLILVTGMLKAQQSDTILPGILALGSDTEKVNRLYARGYAIRNQDPHLAMQYALHCHQLADNSGSDRHLSKALNLLGVLYYKKGELHKALRYHQQALDTRQRSGDRLGMGMSENNIGNVLSDLEQPANAEAAYLRALDHYTYCGDKKRMAATLLNLGAIMQQQKKPDAALENYKRALEIAEGHNDHETRSLCLNNMAQLLFDKGDYEAALSMNYDALKLRQLMESEVEMADSYINLAYCYLKLRDPVLTKDFADSAYHTSKRHDYFEGIQASARLYSEYFSETGDYKQALSWLKVYETERERSLNEEASAPLNFSPGQDAQTTTGPQLKNLWLLFALAFFLVTIPLLMISFKR